MARKQEYTIGTARIKDLSAKTLRLGGDPLNGTPSTEVTATAAELNALDGITATVAELNLLDGAQDDIGAAAGTLNVATEAMGNVMKTTLTLTAHSVLVNWESGDDSGWGTSKLYDFSAGVLNILGVVADLAMDVSASANVGDTGSGDVSLGTTQTADVTLSGTDVDLLPSTAMTDPFVAGAGSAAAHLAAATIFDGHTTAKDLNLNIAFDAGDVTTADGAVLVTGTIVIHWLALGDY